MRWLFLGLIFFAVVARGEGPSSAPTSQPGAAAEFDVHSPVRKWFGELASEDVGKRDAARTALMGLGRGDLPKLRKLV